MKPHITKYPSPQLINSFLESQKFFLSSSTILQQRGVVKELKKEIERNLNWILCEKEHHVALVDKISSTIAKCLIKKKCRQANYHLKLSRQKKARQAQEANERNASNEKSDLSSVDYELLYGVPKPAAAQSCEYTALGTETLHALRTHNERS